MTNNKLIRISYNVIIGMLLLGGVILVIKNFWHFGDVEFTDNAHIEQHITPVNVRVPGYIKEIRFEEYSKVRKGDTLVIIEDAEFRLALAQSRAGIEAAEAAVRLAELNLSYTVIVATADGVIGHKDIHVGQLVQPGQTMCNIVDGSEMWVVANYRETQMPNIAVGSKVRMKVDAVPDVKFTGEVERISDATGAAYSMIPQDNATGNFVKIEQRIPVRIRLDKNKSMGKLRAGMNVECEVEYK